MAKPPVEANAIKKAYPAVDLVKKDPNIAAVLSKTTTNNFAVQGRDSQGNRKTQVPHSYLYRNKLQKRAKRNNDAKTILKLLPDIELSVQILVSSIQSPADMMSTELTYTGAKNLVTSELAGSLFNSLKEYFEEDYKIKPLLPKMLRQILAEKGSYPIAVIPENTIDQFINGDRMPSMESIREHVDATGAAKNIGVLGNYKETESNGKIGISLERYSGIIDTSKINNNLHYCEEGILDGQPVLNYTEESYIRITDNPTVLKFPKLNDLLKTRAIKKNIIKNTNSFSLESYGNNNVKELSDYEIERLVFRSRSYESENVATFKKQNELNRKSVGKPLVMLLPTESVIPVHVPGNVEQHIGYFVILDEEGHPIEAPDSDYYYNQAAKGMGGSNTTTLTSNIIRKVETNMGGAGAGSFDPNNAQYMDYAAQIYADMVERDLISRVKNGIHSSSVAVAKNEEIYRIMLARVLAKKYTQILYLPIEYMTYIAFKYGDDGIGRSLLDETATINTLRTVMMFTDVIASIKNSIGRTEVTMTIPEDDPNPLKTIEHAQEEIVRSRQLGIPLGVTNPSDITDFIQRAGYEWQFEGNLGLPQLKFAFNNTNSNITKPDNDLQDYLRKASIMGMGLSPEMVENGFSSEFATTVVANNLLLGKRIMQYQELFCPLLSDHLRKVASNDQALVSNLAQILEDNFDSIKIELDEDESEIIGKLSEQSKKKLIINRALKEFLNTFQVWLPKPPSVTLQNQLDDLDTYEKGLDSAINAYISSEFLTDATSGEMSSQVDAIKAMIKSHFVRKWLSNNGIMTELSELTAQREDGEPQLNLMKEITLHVEALVRSGVTALLKLKPIADAATNDLQANDVAEGESNTESTDTGSSDTGFDFDMGTETPPETSEEENTGTAPNEEENTEANKNEEVKPQGEEKEEKPTL